MSWGIMGFVGPLRRGEKAAPGAERLERWARTFAHALRSPSTWRSWRKSRFSRSGRCTDSPRAFCEEHADLHRADAGAGGERRLVADGKTAERNRQRAWLLRPERLQPALCGAHGRDAAVLPAAEPDPVARGTLNTGLGTAGALETRRRGDSACSPGEWTSPTAEPRCSDREAGYPLGRRGDAPRKTAFYDKKMFSRSKP